MESYVLFFGNPLLDVSVKISDVNILNKYNLNEDDQLEIEDSVIKDILKDIKTAGLSLQNFPSISNGLCVCLVYGKHRSLVANVGAATHFTLDFLKTSERLQKHIEQASLIHVEGFFLSNRFQVCRYIVEHLQRQRGKMLSYNLNGRYVCEDLTDESSYMAENADLVVGNVVEFETLGRLKYNTMGVKDTVVALHNAWKSLSRNGFNSKMAVGDPRSYGKIFAVTDNSHPVYVAWGCNSLNDDYVSVPKVDSNAIVDTTGAGDTFMAGLMHALLGGLHPTSAARYGAHIASLKIQYNAAEMPPNAPPQLDFFTN